MAGSEQVTSAGGDGRTRPRRAVRRERTRVGIVGAGPAGLALARMLALGGVDTVVIEIRERGVIEATQRAGVLEQHSVRLLEELGLAADVARDGRRHGGFGIRTGGATHRIDLEGLVGASVWLYPQNLVVAALAEVHSGSGGDVRWAVSDVEVDVKAPSVSFTEPDGTRVELSCDLLVGADGSQSLVRHSLPRGVGEGFFIEYPFAWFALLVMTPPSAPEILYTQSARGFTLLSQRDATLQRSYFQCDPAEDPRDWSDDRIWAEMQARAAGPDGFTVKEGPIVEKSVLPFRSYVHQPLRHGSVVLAGDAGHTVPPTGAKGLNLAFADVALLGPAILDWASGDTRGLDAYSDTALDHVWQVQSFSYRMTTLLHTRADATPFEVRRNAAELRGMLASRAGRQYLAEGFAGVASADRAERL
ncbi:4-hydroxybenzoate 3-monooxygenase [Actinotalea sp. M2MS4P-6]|uniref:4-hydroxybenzoate 3-monooxygenase n=1 Tax=Actinotalea sp. M2MS4P-6 TaxID=2983762 RepID=UPI0021E3F081|nr:4-hydroxybenzoate 3-monooxygenase [Actinotalea sp. M2MS4P-6]MCV2394334.1 4-hydroxybenzoate 3-monooxygenase [Actinotalea sp. M2MS4P-6]